MNKKIEFPAQKTFFITWNETQSAVTGYGSVETYQSMETAQPVLTQYVDEEEWAGILSQHGIDLDSYPDLF